MFSKKLVTLILTGGMLLALAIPALAQDTGSTTDSGSETSEAAPARTPLTATTDLFVTTQFRVNLRSGPGINYTILDVMSFGDSLDITGQNEDGSWLRLNFNGTEAWVATRVVSVDGLLETAPVVEAGAGAVLQGEIVPQETEATTDVSGPVAVMTRFNSNLRSSFSTDADVLEIIPFNTELVPEGRTDNSNWLMVTFDEQSGWIYAPILFFASGEIETLPVLATVPAEVTAVE